jgi:hypothetical protein
MAYQVRTTTGYGKRLSDSAKGIVTGFALFIGATVLLFWNEGNFIKTKRSIRETEGKTVIVNDVSTVEPSLNGKVIHASAFANTEEVLTDGIFGVAENAVALKRDVLYYQYKEKEHTEKRDKVGGGEETITTYTYDKEWVSSPINSHHFKDPGYQRANFTATEVEARSVYAKEVSFGGYQLPPFIISSIKGNDPVTVNISEDEIKRWNGMVAENMELQGKLTEASNMVHINGNTVYFGKSPAAAAIGDVKVTITKVIPATISVIAKVHNTTFEDYIAKNGKTFSRVDMGMVSAEKMFADAHSENSTLAWVLRLLGIILAIAGLKQMFSILPTLFKVLPFLGNIVGAGVGLVCTVLGGVWGILIIGISWLFYRPLIGIPLLAIAVAGIWYLNKASKKKKAAEELRIEN